MILLQNQTADTDESQEVFRVYYDLHRPTRVVWAEGVFDGASVALEVKPEGASDFHPEAEFESADRVILEMATMEIRGAVSGAGPATDITLGVS